MQYQQLQKFCIACVLSAGGCSSSWAQGESVAESAAKDAREVAEAEAPVGEAPAEPEIPQVVVSDRGVRGVLTPRGVTVIEPSVNYAHSTSSVVAIEGFTIIPALVIGLINVSQVQRDTFVAATAIRRGFGSGFEAEIYVPYTWRSEDSRQREVLDASSADLVTETDGDGLGDIEASLRYQINAGADGGPIYIAGVRVKSDTGKGPFDVDRMTFETEDGVRVGDVLLEQPTGSGFWGVQPSVTMLYSSAPAVLYGSLSYFWNIEENVNELGKVDPGDAIGASMGIGFAINERTSFSLGYEHNTVLKSTVENDNGLESNFDQIQVGSVLLGVSQRISANKTLNISVAIGATDAASDVQVTVRFPITL